MQFVARGVSRSFGETRALDDVSITLESGMAHALVGENGAGKSTLLKILAGAERKDAGTITLDGRPYAPADLREAETRGVALVFQEITINPSLTIAENVFIDRLRLFARGGFLDRRRLERAAQDVLDRMSAGISVSGDLRALDLGKWKCIEIARALSMEPRVLFFDESTAFLNHAEVDAVLAVMTGLKESGLTIAFVSHRLSDVKAVADRLTILKDGRHVGDFDAAAISTDEIHARMIGRDMSGSVFPARAAQPGPGLIGVSNVSSGRELRSISFEARAGEIVGLAGLKGAGGERVLEALAGAAPVDGGALTFDGKPYAPSSPADAWSVGIAYLPGDRTREGLILGFSVRDNLVMAKPPRRGPFFDGAQAGRIAAGLIDRLRIKARAPRQTCGSLSGGNLQKTLLGKCVAPQPRLLLLNNPTRGVDIGARVEIYRSIRDLADAGMGVILVSEDLPELLGLSDRLLVMREGRVSHEFPAGAEPTEDDVIVHMT